MYWAGLVINILIAGAGYLFLPSGKRLLGLVFFLTWVIWSIFFSSTNINTLGLAIINIASAVIYRNIWSESVGQK